MELSLSAAQRGSVARRAAPVCCGVAAVAATGFLATHDPAAAGARYPTCVFRQMTGLWCPGCGLTRGTYELLHGHVGSALSFNVFTPLAILVVVAAWVTWLRISWGRPQIHLPKQAVRWMAVLLPILILGYGVLRNLPAGPLKALAP
jgi:Protein of unknown function (DUF2752)